MRQKFAVVCFLLAASPVFAQLGVPIITTGGDVVVTVLPSDAGFTSELGLVTPGGTTFIATNRDTGLTVNLGMFPAGQELIFSLFVRESGSTFFTGPGSRNPDGIPHAFAAGFPTYTDVGFEDIFGGGDMDYNDCTFRFENVLPAPGAAAILAMAGLSTLRRRRN